MNITLRWLLPCLLLLVFLPAFGGVAAAEAPKLVVVFGEQHTSTEDSEFICGALPGLAKLGFRELCIEFGEDAAADVSKYVASARDNAAKIDYFIACQARITGMELAAFMKTQGLVRSEIRPEKVAVLPQQTKTLLHLLDAASECGMSVRLVDQPPKPGAPQEGPEWKRQALGSIPQRNAYMVRRIVEGAHPGAGIVLTVGAMHLGRGKGAVSVNDQLEQAGFRTITFLAPTTAKEVRQVFDGWGNGAERRLYGFEVRHADCEPKTPKEAVAAVAAKLDGQ